MRIFKSKRFAKFSFKEGISDQVLCDIITELENGKVDADYGGGVIKQRIARVNSGKSGGYRTIILFKKGKLSFFVYGFSKNAQANITKEEALDFKILAKSFLNISESDLGKLIGSQDIMEVMYYEKNKNI